MKHTYVVFGQTLTADNPQLGLEHALFEARLRSLISSWNGELLEFSARPDHIVAKVSFHLGVDAVERILNALLGEFIDAWTVLGTTRAIHHGWPAAEYPFVREFTQRLLESA